MLLCRQSGVCRSKRNTTSSWTSLQKLAEQRKVGDPFASDTEQGPQVDQGSVRQDPVVHRQGQRTKGRTASPAAIVSAIKATSSSRRFLTTCKDDMSIATDEIFGPVLSVLTFDDKDDMIQPGQQHVLWSGRCRLDARCFGRPRVCQTCSSRYRLGQLLRRLRRSRTVRRIQDEWLRPRTWRRRLEGLHRKQDCHDRVIDCSPVGQASSPFMKGNMTGWRPAAD